MSFLNPVNEPVLRFSSKDVGATQINYATRTAGDIKAVMKACLDTGYGAKAGAGWTTVNETATVIEFVSPSAAMSDYRLGIDDTSTSSTTWYYQYQDVRVNPAYNAPTKSFSYVDKTSGENGWQMLVTERGVYFIEIFYHTTAKKTVARMLWMGQVKSALIDNTGINMSYFCMGYQAQVGQPALTFTPDNAVYRFYRLASYDRIDFNAANIQAFTSAQKARGIAVADTVSEVFLTNTGNVVGKQPAMLLHDVNIADDVLGVKDAEIDGRSVLDIAVSASSNDINTVVNYAKNIMLYLDYWEY